MQCKYILLSSVVLAACHGGKGSVSPTATAATSTLQWKLVAPAEADKTKTGIELVVTSGSTSKTVSLPSLAGSALPINQSACLGTAYPLHDGQLARLTIYNGGASGYLVEQAAGATEVSVSSWSQGDGACPDGKGKPTACPEDKKLITTVPLAAGSKFSETIVNVDASGAQTPFSCK